MLGHPHLGCRPWGFVVVVAAAVLGSRGSRGCRRPQGAAAAARAPGRRGIPGRSPAPSGPRARDGLRALPARPWPARVRSQPLRVRSSSRAGRAGGGGGSGSSPRPRGGGCGEGSEEARPRFLEGRALPTGGALSRPPPAAPGPRLARPGAPGFQRLGRPNVRGRNPRVQTFKAGIRESDRARLGLRSECRWFAPSAGWLRRSRGHLRVPRTVRSGPPTREPRGRLCPGLWGPRAPPAASTPRADQLSAAPSGIPPQGLVPGGNGQREDRSVRSFFFFSR